MYNVHSAYKIQSNMTNVQKDTTLMHTIVLSSQSAPMFSHELETLVKLNRWVVHPTEWLRDWDPWSIFQLKDKSFFFEHECIFVWERHISMNAVCKWFFIYSCISEAFFDLTCKWTLDTSRIGQLLFPFFNKYSSSTLHDILELSDTSALRHYCFIRFFENRLQNPKNCKYIFHQAH